MLKKLNKMQTKYLDVSKMCKHVHQNLPLIQPCTSAITPVNPKYHLPVNAISDDTGNDRFTGNCCTKVRTLQPRADALRGSPTPWSTWKGSALRHRETTSPAERSLRRDLRLCKIGSGLRTRRHRDHPDHARRLRSSGRWSHPAPAPRSRRTTRSTWAALNSYVCASSVLTLL